MLGRAVYEPTLAEDAAAGDGPLSWRSLGLEAMASMLVVWLRRLGDRSFEAQCQWPRMHPLNERAPTVAHHPLIIVESTRQIAAAVQHRSLLAAGRTAFEAVSVSLGLRPGSQPTESGSATHVMVRVTLSDLVPESGGLAAFRVTAVRGGTVRDVHDEVRAAGPAGSGSGPRGAGFVVAAPCRRGSGCGRRPGCAARPCPAGPAGDRPA